MRRYNHSYAKEQIQTTSEQRTRKHQQRTVTKEIDTRNSQGNRSITKYSGPRDKTKQWKDGISSLFSESASKNNSSIEEKGKSKIAKQEPLRRYVLEKLKEERSPKEISERLKIEYSWDMAMQISHEAI